VRARGRVPSQDCSILGLRLRSPFLFIREHGLDRRPGAEHAHSKQQLMGFFTASFRTLFKSHGQPILKLGVVDRMGDHLPLYSQHQRRISVRHSQLCQRHEAGHSFDGKVGGLSRRRRR